MGASANTCTHMHPPTYIYILKNKNKSTYKWKWYQRKQAYYNSVWCNVLYVLLDRTVSKKFLVILPYVCMCLCVYKKI